MLIYSPKKTRFNKTPNLVLKHYISRYNKTLWYQSIALQNLKNINKNRLKIIQGRKLYINKF